MTQHAFVKKLPINLFLFLAMIPTLAVAKLPWEWEKIKPGMTPENVTKVFPKSMLTKHEETWATGEKTMVILTGFAYGGTPYHAAFVFKDRRLTKIHMGPDIYTTDINLIFQPLAAAKRQIDEFRTDALKSGGKKISSTIDLNKKSEFGDDVFQLPEWKLTISCMPHKNADRADIYANFSANE